MGNGEEWSRARDADFRVADLPALRRMLDADSIVMRVDVSGAIVAHERLPELVTGRAMAALLNQDRHAFDAACSDVARSGLPATLEVACDTELVLVPVFANDADLCRYVVCWIRKVEEQALGPAIADLRNHELRYWFRQDRSSVRLTAELSARWEVRAGEQIDLGAHSDQVAAHGLATTVMASMVHGALDALIESGRSDVDILLRIDQPEFLHGILPTVHGSLRASGICAERLMFAIPVHIAVDESVLPVITHLRAMGVRIDIVGLHALTAALHSASDTSDHLHEIPASVGNVDEWKPTLAEVLDGSSCDAIARTTPRDNFALNSQSVHPAQGARYARSGD